MDNIKDNFYYIKKIVKDIEFVIEHTKNIHSDSELENNEVLLDSVLFRIIQVSESSLKLTEYFKREHKEVPRHAIKGMRNRIVHDYGKIDVKVIYDTVKVDLPHIVTILKDYI